MPPLPTEPEPPESVRGGKEDQIDLWGAPVTGDQDNNSGDGGDYGAFTETELHTDDDGTPVVDQVKIDLVAFSSCHLTEKTFPSNGNVPIICIFLKNSKHLNIYNCYFNYILT